MPLKNPDKLKEYQRVWYQNNKLKAKECARRFVAKANREGRCVNCCNPRAEGRKRCQKCLDRYKKHSQKQRKLYPDKTKKYVNDWKNAKRAGGKMCPSCGRPKLGDNSTVNCMFCRNYSSEYQKQRGGGWN